VPHFVVTWTEVALDQYLALDVEQRKLIDRRLVMLAGAPDGDECRYDPGSDTWTATDESSAGFIVYTYRNDGLRLIVLRLVYL
jgi:hypothetical protein